MNELSFQLFKNEWLLTILLISVLLTIISYVIYLLSKKRINKEILIVSLITIVFGLINFTNLGSSKLPTTYYSPTIENEYIILELDDSNTNFNQIYTISGLGDTNSNIDNYQIYYQDIELYGSNDKQIWYSITTLKEKDFYKYNIHEGEYNYQYIKLVFPSTDGLINELALKRSDDDYFIKLKVLETSNTTNTYLASSIIDENNIIPLDPTFYDETYFDEIYHVRNALEISENQYMYAHVHPLLGTRLISVGINIFGMNPFGFRFMGALFSVLALPLFYLILKALFNKPLLSIVGVSLFASDFMHLTTGRIATLEPFSIFFIMAMFYFMIKYIKLDFFNPSLTKPGIYLGLSGLMMSFAWATKWTGLYASIGLALVFFIHLISNYLKAKKDKINLKIFYYKLWRLALICTLAFIILPVSIYFINYLGLVIERAPYTSFTDFINGTISYTQGIFDYHANLEATHPFESSWYHWLFDIRPIWYYFKSVDNGLYTISCFNNPLISWLGIVGVIYTLYASIKHKTKEAIVISLGYFSSLLPWVFIGRCLFSYHYYPSYPFLILAIVYLFKDLLIKNEKYKKIIIGITVVCAILFILFLPVIAGYKTDLNFINTFVRWFESWYFGH